MDLPFVTWDPSMKLSDASSVICVVLNHVTESQLCLNLMVVNNFLVR